MMKTKTHQNKFIRIITTPLRVLAKARDFYVRSMNNYADKVSYGSAGVGGVSYTDPLPRSFSTTLARSNESDDFKELLRVASTSSLGKRVDLTYVLSSSNTSSSSFGSGSGLDHGLNRMVQTKNSNGLNTLLTKPYKGVSRSASVGMAKIEEDKPCEFDDVVDKGDGYSDNNKNGGSSSTKQKFSKLFPRSRSYAVGTTKRNPYAVVP